MDSTIIDTLLQDASFRGYQSHLKLARTHLSTKPIVSYWSMYHVLSDRMSKQAAASQSVDDRRTLTEIMGWLESARAAHQGDPLFDSESNARTFIENYANQLLVKAENEAELGVAPADSIKCYLACANLSTLLPLFGEQTAENAKRIKYCKWKAVNIAKEVREGSFKGASDNYGGAAAAAPTDAEGEEREPEGGSDPGNEPRYGDANIFGMDSSATNNPQPAPRASLSSRSVANDENATENVQDDFVNLTLSDSDMKKAELLIESALYAIRADDKLTAVNNIKQTLALLQKRR